MSRPNPMVWEPGFEPERKLVVVRLAGFQWCYPKAHPGVRWFHHRVIAIPVENWLLDIESWPLGAWCKVSTRLEIRFQPTHRFVEEHLEDNRRAGEIVRETCHGFLVDQVERLLSGLPADIWLETDHADIETCIEDDLQEFLILSGIQSRCRCRLRFTFQAEAPQADQAITAHARHQAVIQTLQARLHTARLHHQQACFEQETEACQRRIEQQQQLSALLERETETLEQRKAVETRKARAEIALQEVATREKYESDLRLRLDQIQQEAHLGQVQLESERQEKHNRAAAMTDVEQYLHREIEFLTLERQRLLLEEEIQTVKRARLRGWTVSPALPGQ